MSLLRHTPSEVLLAIEPGPNLTVFDLEHDWLRGVSCAHVVWERFPVRREFVKCAQSDWFPWESAVGSGNMSREAPLCPWAAPPPNPESNLLSESGTGTGCKIIGPPRSIACRKEHSMSKRTSEVRHRLAATRYCWTVSVIGLAALSTGSCVPTSDGNLRTYKNDAMGIQIDYPYSWNVVQVYGSVFACAKPEIVGGCGAGIIVDRFTALSGSLAVAVADVIQEMSQLGWTLLSRKSVVLQSGQTAEVLDYTKPDSFVQSDIRRGRLLIVVRDEYQFWVDCSSSEVCFSNEETVFEKTLSSVKLF